MRDRIEINKEMIPYTFSIVLGGEWFELGIGYNQTRDLFTVTLSKDDTVLVYNEPVIYGMPLFGDLYRSGLYPMLDIVPYDESEQETAVTWDNLGDTVFLTIAQGGETDG